MSLRHRMRRQVDVTTITEGSANVDDYGNPAESSAITRSYWAWISQVGSTENSVNRETAKATWVLFLEPTAVIYNYSTVTFDGETCRVVGVPNTVYSGRGLHHIEVTVESFEG